MPLNSKRLWNIIINQPLSASPTDVEILNLFKKVIVGMGAQMTAPEAPKKREIAAQTEKTIETPQPLGQVIPAGSKEGQTTVYIPGF
jgi:hypothetical protein